MTAIRVLLLSFLLTLVSACAVYVISPEDPMEFIPDRISEMKVGGMDRSKIRAILGKPYLSSINWRSDHFRADAQTPFLAG